MAELLAIIACLRRAILGGRTFLPNCSQGCVDPTSPNVARTGQSFLHKKFVSELGYLDVFSNAGGSKLSDVENNAKFRTF